MPTNNSKGPRKSTDSPTKRSNRRTSATKMGPSDAVVSADDKYAATKWGGETTVDLEVPSGQVCLARRPGLNGLLKAGVLHDIDPLLPLVDEHVARVEGQQADAEEKMNRKILDIFKDEKKFATIQHMLDRMLCYVVIKPQILHTPDDITQRQPDKIYADMIDLEDKLFILDWSLGGAEDVAQFREKFQAALGNLASLERNESATE
jgi:hypothetical protein